MSLIESFQNLRSPVLDILAGLFSLLGNETVFLCILGVIFWCLNKRVAYRISFSYILAGPFLFIVRGFARVQRPWIRNTDITPPDIAAKGASGYSMPSAHSLRASMLAARFITNSRLIAAGIFAALAAILAGLSRIYLGLNTWLEVLISIIIAAVSVFAVDNILDNLSLDPKGRPTYALVLTIPTLLMLGINLSLYVYGSIDLVNLSEAVNSSGIYLGLIIAWLLDSVFIDFTEKCDFSWQQVLKALIGIIIIMIIRGAVLTLLKIAAPDFYFSGFFCNLAAVLIAFGLYPFFINRFFAARYR